jgi:hypothetical protein
MCTPLLLIHHQTCPCRPYDTLLPPGVAPRYHVPSAAAAAAVHHCIHNLADARMTRCTPVLLLHTLMNSVLPAAALCLRNLSQPAARMTRCTPAGTPWA